MSKDKKQEPGMADAENVFEIIEAQEKEARRRAWLEEHYNKEKKDSKPEGGEHKDLQEG